MACHSRSCIFAKAPFCRSCDSCPGHEYCYSAAHMASLSTPGRLDAVLRRSEYTNSDDPPSGETTFLLRFVRKNRQVSTFSMRGCV